MSRPVNLADFLPPYLAEVEELLGLAHTQLLTLETAARGGAPQPRAVRELFRVLHTIKGLSAMVDVEPVVALTHLMEASVRAADRAGGKLPPASIEPLLQGLKAVEVRVRALGAGKPVPPAPSALLDALEGLEGAERRAAPRAAAPAEVQFDLEPALASKLSASEREQLTQGVQGGRRALRVDFAPSPQRSAAGLTINTVRERVSQVAEIVKVVPLSRPGGAPGSGLVFALLVLSSGPDAALAAAVEVAPAEVRLVAQPPPPPEEDAALASGALAGDLSADPSSDLAGVLPEAPLDEEVAPQRHGIVRVETARLDEAMERLAALVVTRSRLQRAAAALTASGANTRELVQILQENARQLRDLRAAIVRVRMVKVGEVLERLPLIVRGLRRSTGKQVALQLELGAAELDKAVGDRLFPAIVHLVRNAVDHALEPPEERRRAGKPEEGLLRIVCRERSNSQLEVQVSDDGRGVDAAAVARRAGVPVPQSDEELLELLCRPGLSTREEVTTTSGRGMGMDIVKRIAVDQLGGELRLQTEAGVGTTFTLRVPLTISIVDAFVFESGQQRYAVPVATVEELVEVDAARLVRGPGGAEARGEVQILERRGQAVPLLRLATVLGQPAGEGGGQKALVVRQRGEPVAFAVDRMLGQQEIVIRPLEDVLVKVRGVSGATDLGDGRPTLVLDLIALGGGAAAEAQRRERVS
ncbi:chemotaxis protein CheA [Aggregicoccus sp. 17bor-14]|uniref:chemotaxis protein CheA n=1 Tax=Myxococcaceae TaxID=31 RepID=UPI0012F3587D|nr:chemotaxis protein CheW [Simulacricoccus sp. 17bor-14]MRI91012.1 chemotaxis protein CheA [Aggregicoccus sp. 17bor-14]